MRQPSYLTISELLETFQDSFVRDVLGWVMTTDHVEQLTDIFKYFGALNPRKPSQQDPNTLFENHKEYEAR